MENSQVCCLINVCMQFCNNFEDISFSTTGLVVQWSEPLTTNPEVPGSIPGSTVGIFLEGEDSRGDHGLGRSVEFRFKAPPSTTSSAITTHTPSGQCNCASWASQSQTSVTLLPCPGGRTTKSTKDMWWHWTKKNIAFSTAMNRGSGIVLWQWAALPMSLYIVVKSTNRSMTEPRRLQVTPSQPLGAL